MPSLPKNRGILFSFFSVFSLFLQKLWGGAQRQKKLNFKQIIMYNRTNPAVIKSILSKLPKAELIKQIEFMKTQIQELEPSNKRTMFLNLYHFSNQLPIMNQVPLKSKK